MRILLLALSLGAALLPAVADAQVRPDLPWRTIGTEHFRVHFTPELEALARRTARNAELAWTELARELVPPRGIVDIVVADNVDYANGYASPFPTNRIVVYARPPVEELSLRNHPDWNKELVTHELVHIFHLDRVRGAWWLAQRVFGRAAPLFPNTYAPSWIIEGLAVHYETRFGDGGGRLAGTEFRAMVRAAALEDGLPSLDALSLSALRYPRASSVYVYGGFAMSRAEPVLMKQYVETASARLIPWRQDANARDAFGLSFTKRWEVWRDSVTREASGVAVDAEARARTRVLTTHGYTARFPRFVTDASLLYVGEDGRRTTGRYTLTLDGARERLGRQNGVDVSSPSAGGGSVQGEFDWVGPYSLRSDLTRRGGGVSGARTRDARLSSPDVHRPTGRVVAVQTIPGSTRLVTMDAVGAPLTELVAGTLNVNWSEPRWSHDGTRVAAARWEDGGRSSIVVLDADGRVTRTFAPRAPAGGLTIASSPAWIPGDTSILFVSDHEGRAMIYRGDLHTGGYARVWATATSLNTPDVSPDGRLIAAVELTGEGYRVVTHPMPGVLPLTMEEPAEAPASRPESARADTAAPVQRYSPLRTLLPRWWLPVVATTDPGTSRFGLMTNGRDVLDRHAWALTATLEPKREELTADFIYQYAGLGRPVLTLAANQDWRHGGLSDSSGAFVGYLGRVDRATSLSATFAFPRVRYSTALVIGGELSSFSYKTYPANLLPLVAGGTLLGTFDRQAAFASLSFSTMQRPALAVTVEDGIALGVTHRQRFASGINREDVGETVVNLSLAKSLPLPGYARHVLAARGAYGFTAHTATTAFGAGGVSGGTVEIVPTVTFGDERRTFFVRGFEGNAQVGVRAAAASVEYRAPLALVGRGIRFLPLFFQRTSLTAFADAGAAWCEVAIARSFACRAPVQVPTTMASVGGEFTIDAALDYDSVYRFRFGFAHPVRGLAYAARTNTVYFTLGGTF